MNKQIILSLLLTSLFSLTTFSQETDTCPDPSIEKYKSVQKEFDSAAMDEAMRAGARIVVMIPGIATKNGEEIWNEIQGGYECLKDTLTGGAAWYNTVQKATFCPVATVEGIVTDASETIVKSVAQLPHAIGDLSDLGDNLAQKGLNKTAELIDSSNPFYVFGGLIAIFPLGAIDGIFKTVSLATHFAGNVVDAIINYNIMGAAKSAVKIGQGIYLLNPETIVDSAKDLGCRVATIPQKIIFSLGEQIKPMTQAEKDEEIEKRIQQGVSF